MRVFLLFITCCGAWFCLCQSAQAQESPFNDFCVQCTRGDLQAVTEILNAKPEFATTSDKPLVNAAENGRAEIVKVLLARGATQNARTRALHLAVTHMYEPNPDYFSRLKEVITLLLAGGANPVDPSKHKGFTDFVDLSISSSDAREDAQLAQRRREVRAIFANAKVLKAEQEKAAKADAESQTTVPCPYTPSLSLRRTVIE